MTKREAKNIIKTYNMINSNPRYSWPDWNIEKVQEAHNVLFQRKKKKRKWWKCRKI